MGAIQKSIIAGNERALKILLRDNSKSKIENLMSSLLNIWGIQHVFHTENQIKRGFCMPVLSKIVGHGQGDPRYRP